MVRKERTTQRKRKRKGAVLNIIYFVDAAKTRSIKLSVTTVNLLLGLTATMLTWSVVSVFVLYELSLSKMNIREEFSEILTTLLEYQVRFDGVFESAYPNPETISTAAASLAERKEATDSKTNGSPSESNEKPQTELQASADATDELPSMHAEDAAEMKKQAIARLAKPEETKKGTPTESPLPAKDTPIKVAVRNQKIATGRATKLTFEIHNENRERRADGVVWAVARFGATDESPKYITAPRRVGYDPAEASFRNPKKAERFSIQRFREIDLEFQNPDPQRLHLESVVIHVDDHRHPLEQPLQFPVPLSPVKPPAP